MRRHLLPKGTAFGCGALACVVLLLTTMAYSQEFRGTILGRVTDQKKGVIPGATVTVTNENTNISASTITADDGGYTVQFLTPGTYRVEVEIPGFKKYSRSGVSVAVGQRATVDVVLEVGQVQEVVNVTANASLLESATGGMGQVVDRQKVESLPLNGRMVFMMNRLSVGVIWQVPTFGATGTSGLRPFDNLGGSAWSINGGRVSSNEFLLDGAPNSTRGRFNYSPPVDAVEEFKIQTNTYDAQYGRTGGGVINMTLKSGTNDFHGNLWEFIKYGGRKYGWQANNTVNNATGQPSPSHQFNEYGATITGPVLKNRTFFHFTWEGLRERVPFPQTTSVPTAAERAGDFSQTYRDTPQPTTIYDPLTTRTQGGRLVRDPFPGNRIPAERMNPIAQRALSDIYPLPNIAGQRLNNFVNPINKGIYNYNSELVRIDHRISDRHKIFGTFFRNHRDEFRSNNGLQGTFANQGQWPQTRNNHGGIFDWVYTISPTALFNFRTGFTRFVETNFQSDVHGYDRNRLGFQNLPGRFLPRIDLQQYTGVGVGSEGVNTADNTGSVQANYAKTLSHHTVKFGGEYRNIRSNPTTTGNSNGFFNFTRDFTRRDPNTGDPITGNSIASFLLGYPQNADVGAGQARSMQWHYWAFFFQDDVRVSPNLTLNLGLRWDYEAPPTERYNRLVRGFAFDQPSPLADVIRNRPGAENCPACADLRGGLRFAGVGGDPRGLFKKELTNFQPRVGLAYRWGEKTVIRGGYGSYYASTPQFGPQTGFFVPTPYIAYNLGGAVGIPETAVNVFGSPFPLGLRQAPGASLGLLTQVGQGISFDDPGRRIPYIYQFNLSIQREIARDLIADVAFVGSRARHLPVARNINEVSREDLARGAAYLQQVVPNPFAGLLPGSPINGPTVQRQQLLRPYPQFLGINQNALSIGESSYHSFQFRVEKRLSQGLTLISSYTLSKNIEKTNFLNPQDVELARELTDFDRTHLWTFSGIYNLPFGRGRAYGADAPGWVNHFIGGWQLNWIYTMASGRPLGYPNLERLGNAELKNPSFDRWFNTCYIDTNGIQTNCQPGEQPVWFQRQPFTLRTTPNRFSNIRVPWRPTLDASLFKNFNINERVRLEYRLETFNTFNTVIYVPPVTDFTSSNFGRIPQPRNAIYFPRNVQMGLKLYF